MKTALILVTIALFAFASAAYNPATPCGEPEHVCGNTGGKPATECAHFGLQALGKDDYAEDTATRSAKVVLVKAGTCFSVHKCVQKGDALATLDGKTISHVTYCGGYDAECEKCDAPQTRQVEETEAPETEAPETEAPETEAPETEAPETEAPTTAAPTTPAPTTAAPTTAAPTTAAPTTAAPTTAAPTTAAPTTAAPTTAAPTEAPCDARPLEVIRKELLCLSKYVASLAKAVATSKVPPATISAKLSPYQDAVVNAPPAPAAGASAAGNRAARNPDGSLTDDSIGAIVVGSIVGAALLAAVIVAFSVVRKRKVASSNTTPLLQEKGWQVE